MSRIGRLPITVPAGVEVKVDGSVVNVKGSKGERATLWPARSRFPWKMAP